MKESKEIFQRMSELNRNNSRIDMHMHTDWTDGKFSMNEMIGRSMENGLAAVAITDHIREDSEYYDDYLDELRQCQLKFRSKIYSGFEAKISGTNGEIDISDDAAYKAEIVIASVHRIPMEDRLVYPRDIEQSKLARIERDLSIAAIKNNGNSRFNVIGHCGGMSIAAYGQFPIEYFEDVINVCREYDVAFEFNYKYHNKYEYNIKNLLIQYNPYVSVGSDAHEIKYIAHRSFVE